MTTLNFTLLVQRRLISYGAQMKADGEPGNLTLAALDRYLPPLLADPPKPSGSGPTASEMVDARSEKQIATLLLPVSDVARQLVRKAADLGIKIIVTSGTRSYAEQARIYEQPRDGKDNDGDGRVDEADEKVSNAPPGYSNHNFGIAFDVTIFSGKTPIWESPAYDRVGEIGKSLGLTWGGDFDDKPHFCLRPKWAKGMTESQLITGLRKRAAEGKGAFDE